MFASLSARTDCATSHAVSKDLSEWCPRLYLGTIPLAMNKKSPAFQEVESGATGFNGLCIWSQ